MRYSVSIAALALLLPVEAALRFAEPVWRPDLGLELPGLEASVAAPLDMPRAEAYLVTRDGESWLEDRFDTFDLWQGLTVRGRWCDGDGNELHLARLSHRPPGDAPGTVSSRRVFRDRLAHRAVNPRDPAQRDMAAVLASPVELGRAVRPRRSRRANFTDLVCYSTTNELALAYAFRPRDPDPKAVRDWYLAVLVAAADSDMAEVRARFEEDFLDRISVPSVLARRSLPKAPPEPGPEAGEAELLRADLRAAVANYDEWHCVDAEDVTVLDDLGAGVHAGFIASLTNELPRLRRAFAETAPSPLAATNALAVVRVFRSRREYLAYVGVDAAWTAALWSPEHRELVLYHPEGGTEELLHTVWHEAFHQHLAYAGAMVSSSPWFNEGHAQLFEHSHVDRKGRRVFDRDAQAAAFVHEYAPTLAPTLPALMRMDYDRFYEGEREMVAVRYRVAWSIAYFLSVGAPELRGRPYEELRARYMAALVKTRSMVDATRTVLGDEKSRDAFFAAWLAFWREH